MHFYSPKPGPSNYFGIKLSGGIKGTSGLEASGAIWPFSRSLAAVSFIKFREGDVHHPAGAAAAGAIPWLKCWSARGQQFLQSIFKFAG